METTTMTASVAKPGERSGMIAKLRALAWEECRVGGAIAATCTIVGFVLMLMYRWLTGADAWARGEGILPPGVLATPFLTGLLLVLNPDHTGELVGGYCKRVLRLPVPTWAAVLVPLLARAILVLTTAALTYAVCRLLFSDGPGPRSVLLVLMVYLIVQTLDWLRAPLSGLSSLLLLAGTLCVFLIIRDSAELWSAILHTDPLPATMLLLLTGFLGVAAYGVSVVAVGAARVGRRRGVPEIWEWPQRFAKAWPARSASFSSPVSAQVWCELRQSAWIIPSITFGLWLIALLVLKPGRTGDRNSDWAVAAAVIPFVTLLIAAAFHGARTGVLGFRSPGGNAGFLYLQPLSDGDYVRARMISNMLVFVPTLIAVTAIHMALIAIDFVSDILVYNVRMGASSPREVVWTLSSRGILLGLLTWPLLAAGTRAIRNTIALAFAVSILVLAVVDRYYRILGIDWTRHFEYSLILSVYAGLVCLLACMLIAYARAWSRNLISRRALVGWAGTWILGAWIVFRAVPMQTVHGPLPALGVATGVVLSLAVAAVIPFPYAAFLLDVCRRRHSALPKQEPPRRTAFSSSRVLAYALASCLVVWLGWPGTPGYEALLRSRGYPATLAEMNAWYTEVPAERNAAEMYAAVMSERDDLDALFMARMAGTLKDKPIESSPQQYIVERLLFMGYSDSETHDAIPADVLEMTEAYWQDVTSRIAPQLEQIAREGYTESRYPIDLNQGFNVQLEHLARLRQCARELLLDAFHWSRAGDTARALDSVRAIIPLADSLAKEPLLISHLVRVAILGIANGAAETVANHATLSDAELQQLQRMLGQALPPSGEGRITDRAIMGEAVIGLNIVSGPMNWDEPDPDARYQFLAEQGVFQAIWLFPEMAFPADAERMSMVRFYDESVRAGADARLTVAANRENSWDDELIRAMQYMTPRAATIFPALARAYEAEWRIRMQLAMAQTALGALRFRLAKGHLPDLLDALVPTYISEIPGDIYKTDFGPVSYRKRDDGSFVIYSFGMNRQDDEGIPRNYEKDSKADDFAFTVGPLAPSPGL